jgi:hypothetical protein
MPRRVDALGPVLIRIVSRRELDLYAELPSVCVGVGVMVGEEVMDVIGQSYSMLGKRGMG